MDGQTGRIISDHYKIDLPTKHADLKGGSKHASASAAGMYGCLAIKCSEDCCMDDGKGKGKLKIFSGVKAPESVEVKPNDNFYDDGVRDELLMELITSKQMQTSKRSYDANRKHLYEVSDDPFFSMENSQVSDSNHSTSVHNVDRSFLVNNVSVDLPSLGTVTRSVAETVCNIVLYGARNGAGECQPCKGMLVIVGSEQQFNDFGYVQGMNKFKGEDIKVSEWKDHQETILSCFLQDLGLFVDGQTGKILADHYKVDLQTRYADRGGGSKHVSASGIGMKGCLAIKCSEDCCMADGKGKNQLKIFSGVKTPVNVDVKPTENEY